jgi:hypothetical protein
MVEEKLARKQRSLKERRSQVAERGQPREKGDEETSPITVNQFSGKRFEADRGKSSTRGRGRGGRFIGTYSECGEQGH